MRVGFRGWCVHSRSVGFGLNLLGPGFVRFNCNGILHIVYKVFRKSFFMRYVSNRAVQLGLDGLALACRLIFGCQSVCSFCYGVVRR